MKPLFETEGAHFGEAAVVKKRFGMGVAVATLLVGLAIAPAGLRDIGVRGADGDLFVLASAAAKSVPSQPAPQEKSAQEPPQDLSPFTVTSLVDISPLGALAADRDNCSGLRTSVATTGARKEKTARVAALPAQAAPQTPASPRKPARRLASAPGQTGCVRCLDTVASRTLSGRGKTPLVAFLSKTLLHKGSPGRAGHNAAREPRGATQVLVASSFPPLWFKEKL